MNDRTKFFHDFVDGGAWPFLVRGVICQVYSDNERDLNLLIRLLVGWVTNLLISSEINISSIAILMCFLARQYIVFKN